MRGVSRENPGVAIPLFVRTLDEYSEMEGSSFDREVSKTGEAVV